MEKYCIIANVEKDKDFLVSKEIKAYLEAYGKSCKILDRSNQDIEQKNKVYRYTDPVQIEEDTECILVLGGDGTLIQAARDLSGKDIPLLGVNLGTLGYLAGVEKQHILSALDQLMEDKYTLEQRMMLEGTLMRNGTVIKKDVAAL